jgi:tripartite-type tricarboxylate transporter receptor subunit TctC
VTSLHRAAHINKLAFDTVKDLTPIIRVGGYLYGVLVKPDSKHKTLKDLIEYAKANPGQASYMASGIGTGGHIAAEEMAANAGVKFNHLPSKGDQESSAALLGGHVDFISTTSGWIPLVEAGQLKLLATYGESRVKRFPDVATVKESGYKVVHDSPIGIVGPKGMSAERVKVLHDAFQKALSDSGFLKAMGSYEMPVLYQNTADFATFWAEAYVEAGDQVKNYIKP